MDTRESVIRSTLDELESRKEEILQDIFDEVENSGLDAAFKNVTRQKEIRREIAELDRKTTELKKQLRYLNKRNKTPRSNHQGQPNDQKQPNEIKEIAQEPEIPQYATSILMAWILTNNPRGIPCGAYYYTYVNCMFRYRPVPYKQFEEFIKSQGYEHRSINCTATWIVREEAHLYEDNDD
jgi:hypothetical protein